MTITNKNMFILSICLCLNLIIPFNSIKAMEAGETDTLLNEIQVTGYRTLIDLRNRVREAEINTYDVFNKYNDEERFMISCRTHKPTGTSLTRQVCQAEFEIRAARNHASDYYTYLRDFYDPNTLEGQNPPHSIPFAAVIASQQNAYKKKMKEIAEQHPEFLQALIEYSDLKNRYETAAGKSEQNSE